MLFLAALNLVLVILMSIVTYQAYKLIALLSKIKMRFAQNNVALRTIYKHIQLIDQKISFSTETLENIQTNQATAAALSKNKIETQYDLAKDFLKKDKNISKTLLHSCDITDEELELLTGLVTQEE